MFVRKLFVKRALFLALISVLCFSTCSAFNARPVSNLNSHDLVVTVNGLLSLAQYDYRCSTPVFHYTDENGKVFGAHVGELNAYNPKNGMVVFIEFPTGETRGVSAIADKTDRVKYNQVCFFMACILRSCGLTTNEATQLLHETNRKLGNNTQYGYIWSRAKKHYYVLAVRNAEGMDNFVLYATNNM